MLIRNKKKLLFISKIFAEILDGSYFHHRNPNVKTGQKNSPPVEG